MDMIDFTNCDVNRFRAYGGANGNKINVRYGGKSYMLKFPPKPRCCFSKRMRKLFRKNEKSVLQFCNKSSKTKRAFTKVLMPCKRPF